VNDLCIAPQLGDRTQRLGMRVTPPFRGGPLPTGEGVPMLPSGGMHGLSNEDSSDSAPARSGNPQSDCRPDSCAISDAALGSRSV
jgi:hypothetical protein